MTFFVQHDDGSPDFMLTANYSEGASAHVVLTHDGTLSSSIAATPHKNEDNSLNVCQMLLFQLCKDESGWILLKDVSKLPYDPSYVDFIVANGSDEAWVAVTKADVSPMHFRALATSGLSDSLGSPSESARLLQEAIASLGPDRRNGIPEDQRMHVFLALDAFQTPRMYHPASIKEFKLRYGDWARALGYKGIWLLGNTDVITYRVDR